MNLSSKSRSPIEPKDSQLLFDRRQLVCGLAACFALTPNLACARKYCADSSGGQGGTQIPLADYRRFQPALVRWIENEGLHLVRYFGVPNATTYVIPGSYAAAADTAGNYIVLGSIRLNEYARRRLDLIIGLLAHENAHLFQGSYNVDLSLRDISGHTTKLVELHADYLAGTYLAWRHKSREVDATELSSFFFDLGSQGTHGNRQERYLAFANGFLQFRRELETMSNIDVKRAGAMGLKYVQEYLKGS